MTPKSKPKGPKMEPQRPPQNEKIDKKVVLKIVLKNVHENHGKLTPLNIKNCALAAAGLHFWRFAASPQRSRKWPQLGPQNDPKIIQNWSGSILKINLKSKPQKHAKWTPKTYFFDARLAAKSAPGARTLARYLQDPKLIEKWPTGIPKSCKIGPKVTIVCANFLYFFGP